MPQIISGSMFADALITTLTTNSGSIFDSASLTGNLSKNDFGILDTTVSACVFIILPGAFTNKPLSYGNPMSLESSYELRIKAMVRDVGNSACVLNMVWQAERDLSSTLQADETLGESAMLAYLEHGGGWDGMTVVSSGGTDWIPLDFSVRVIQTT